MKIYTVLFLLIIATGCTKSPDMLEQALRLPGANRAELEKVLLHYKDEPLKLKAARFLIGNMPGHVSYKNQPYVEKYYDEIDSVNQYAGRNNAELAALYEAIVANYPEPYAIIQDLQTITAGYLIDNIDKAFNDWQNGYWATHLTFEEFCEYLLPYKTIECQTLDNWREYLSDTIYGNLLYLPYRTSHHSPYWACFTVQEKLVQSNTERGIDNVRLQYPVRRMHTLMHTLLKRNCDDKNIANVSVLRAKGIPAMIDFTPYWPNCNSGHSWCVILEKTGKNEHFNGFHSMEDSYLGTPIAKIFRRCYAINPEILELNLSGEKLPALFNNLHIIDVTDEYLQTDDISVKLERRHGKCAYLSVFNYTDWKPIQWGKINGRKAEFKKMGRDVVYLPLCLSEERGLIPVAPPFILTLHGEIKPVVPDMTQRQTLKLTRKYPAFRLSSRYAEKVVGAKIQAANNADFSDAVTVHTIDKYGTDAGEILLPDTLTGTYRYWRYYSAPGGQCNIAELYFFRNGQNVAGQGKIIGSPAEDENYPKKHVFDNDPLTCFSSPELSDSWVGLDFGEPVHINRIIYLPRTDGNMVTYGDEYELKYWNDNKWNSLGRIVADNVYVTFENCPVGALFLLHNCTRGVEERIFTYENDKQIWW
jgi:hypothetical protein